MATSAPASAADLVFSSWAARLRTRRDRLGRKVHREDRHNVLQDGPTDYGKLKAMVGECRHLGRSRRRGRLRRAGRQERSARKARLLSYRQSKLDRVSSPTTRSAASIIPSSLVATRTVVDACQRRGRTFSIRKSSPGKRTFYKWSAPGVIEAALLADGVPADKLYRLISTAPSRSSTLSRATSSGGSGGAQSHNSLRLLRHLRQPLERSHDSACPEWHQCRNLLEQNITAADSLVVPKGAKNKEAAMQFIALATSAEAQAELAV